MAHRTGKRLVLVAMTPHYHLADLYRRLDIMPKFRVTYPEVWNVEYIVEAEDEDEAQDIASERRYTGEEPDDRDYAWTMDVVVEHLENDPDPRSEERVVEEIGPEFRDSSGRRWHVFYTKGDQGAISPDGLRALGVSPGDRCAIRRLPDEGCGEDELAR